MIRPALVVFDLAGTTVIDPDGVGSCLRAALNHCGLVATTAETNAVMGIPKPEAIKALVKMHQRNDLLHAIDEIHKDFKHRMIYFYREDPRVEEVPGTSRIFELLKHHGIAVALDTGFSRDITDELLKRMPWTNASLVTGSICSDEVPRGRPYPDMIFNLMKKLKIETASIVAKVGDTPSDLQEGHNAGCGWVIGVTQGSHSKEQLLPFTPTHLISNVAELQSLWVL